MASVMTHTLPRYEVVATLGGFLGRFVDPRGYDWQTARTYPTERRALVAIFAITGHTAQPIAHPSNGYPPEWTAYTQGPDRIIEVRAVDERIVKNRDGSCNVADCTSRAESKGMCGKHYRRVKVHGTTDLLQIVGFSPAVGCALCGGVEGDCPCETGVEG